MQQHTRTTNARSGENSLGATRRKTNTWAIALAATIVAAVGNPSAIAQCQTWQPLGGGVNGSVYALSAYEGELIAGGFMNERIQRWDGLSWQSLGGGMDSGVHALTTYNGELIAGGIFTTAGGQPANRIARWNGAFWQPLGSGLGLDTPSHQVWALTVYGDELVAAGRFTVADGQTTRNVALWDGTSWLPMSSGPDNRVFALTVYNGELIAAGQFSFIFDSAGGALIVNRIARWNGLSWQPLGQGLNGDVISLTVHDGELIAGGFFTTAGGEPANRVARWNGSSWQPLGDGMDDGVHALTTYNGDLIAAGQFTSADGQPLNGIARWNGSSWQSIGVGTSQGPIRALGLYDFDLIAGGEFTQFGGVSANFVARYGGEEPEIAPDGQPQSTLVPEGASAVLNVLVGNPEVGPFTYQWFKDGLPLTDDPLLHISGATTASLVIDSFTDDDFGLYHAQVSTDCGSAFSTPVAVATTSGGPGGGSCPADLNNSGEVNAADLALLLGGWGACAD